MAARPQTPTLAGNLGGDDSPPYYTLSVSNLVARDMEYHIPYSDDLITNQTKLAPGTGQTFAQTISQSNVSAVIAARLRDYVLVDVLDYYKRTFLVFAQNTLPAIGLTPSTAYTKRKTWEWPAVWRKLDYNFDVGPNGNLINVTITPDVSPRFTGPTVIRITQWWTTQPWPDHMLLATGRGLQTSPITWDYFGIARGSVTCLHPDVRMPPLTGIQSVRGQAGINRNIQGILYPETLPATWSLDVIDDTQEQIRGRWMRELQIAEPPYNPLLFPKPPYAFSS